MSAATSTSTHGGISSKISHTGQNISSSVQELGSASSKQTNKEKAKGHTGLSWAGRAKAGVKAMKDSVTESGHHAAAQGHHTMAKH
ncbi:hypothetical protein BCR35DRAFT_304580 [Leucosporidium creatinivorum]|uniref:Uncharacterized protein n=1 Tax=Leucosporidium creatinivorum TaxID=106004 RepID=A0A1Y2FA56_9BASI|nr:hypothetical protein BCR35DRAFT_304580 [Leucosporidium creatinivorum]